MGLEERGMSLREEQCLQPADSLCLPHPAGPRGGLWIHILPLVCVLEKDYKLPSLFLVFMGFYKELLPSLGTGALQHA